MDNLTSQIVEICVKHGKSTKWKGNDHWWLKISDTDERLDRGNGTQLGGYLDYSESTSFRITEYKGHGTGKDIRFGRLTDQEKRWVLDTIKKNHVNKQTRNTK